MATQREASKQEWTTRDNLESINAGSLQRIADAVEKMAGNYTSLQNDRDMYQRWFREEKALKEKLQLRVSALQGVITRMKKARTNA